MPPKKSIDFEKIFTIVLTAMWINGSHPKITRDGLWLVRFLMMHGIYTTVFTIMAYNIYLNIMTGNFSEACRNSSACVIYSVITFQYFTLVFHQETITKIIAMMKADFTKDMPADEREIVLEYALKGRKVGVQWTVVVVYTVIIFQVKHIFLEFYTYITDDWQLLELYPLTYPTLVEDHKKHPVVYTLLYIVVFYYILYTAVTNVGFVPLGPMFMVHACGQLEIVKKRILALYEDGSTEEVEAKVRDIVKHLQYIYGFMECVKDAFRLIYEITLKGAPIMLSVTAYEIMGSFKRGEVSIDFITMIIGIAYISSAPCYYSDKLMEKGEEIRLAVYSCGWETRYEHSVRKTLLLTLLRTLQPTAMRTIFLTMCLDALTDIYQQAYALFNLMNAAWG